MAPDSLQEELPHRAAPEMGSATWLAFTPEHNEDAAAATFVSRFREPPEFIFESRGLLLAGPIPSQKEGQP